MRFMIGVKKLRSGLDSKKVANLLYKSMLLAEKNRRRVATEEQGGNCHFP